MPNLDVSPMIAALRTSPEEFEMHRESLYHMPSRHTFQFDREGNVTLSARCDCVLLSVSREQSVLLWRAVQEWQASYWRPLQINREFASHFRGQSALRRLLIRLVGRLHQALISGSVTNHRPHDAKTLLTPAE